MNAASATWRSAMAKSGRPVAILTSGNQYHPNSVESSLCKGGTDIINATWGVSPYLTALFNRFYCAVVKVPVPPLDDRVVGFARHHEEYLDGARRRIEEFFDVSLAGHDCKEIKSPDLVLVYCLPRGTG